MSWCEEGDMFITTNNYYFPMGTMVMCIDPIPNYKVFYSFEHKKSISVSSYDKEFVLKVNPSDKLAGKKICITGTLDHPRKLYEKIIEVHGGIFVSSVSKNTSFLIVQSKTWSSSKTQKAKSYGVQIIDFVDFVNILKS